MPPKAAGRSDIFRTVSGLSRYVLRNDGEVISLCRRKSKILKGGSDKDGYRKFVLIDDNGKRRHVRRACLICEAFHGPRPKDMNVRHKDGTRQNDSPENLEWATQTKNIADMKIHGTVMIGIKNHRAKLSADQVLEIKRNLEISCADFSRKFGVSVPTISAIRTGKTWNWLNIEKAFRSDIIIPEEDKAPIVQERCEETDDMFQGDAC